MSRRKTVFAPHWVQYEVAYLVSEHIEAWKDFCRERDRLQEGPLGKSPSEMHRKNMWRGQLEMSRSLLNIALRETGPVSSEGRLFRSSESTYRDPEPADDSIQKAGGLFIEILSPLNGMGRKCR